MTDGDIIGIYDNLQLRDIPALGVGGQLEVQQQFQKLPTFKGKNY